MRAYAFLGDALRAYQSATVDWLRHRTGVTVEPLVDGELDALPAVADGPPALLFLCGLPYVRCRDAGQPVEPLVAPVAMGDDAPEYRTLLLGRPGLDGASLDSLEDLHLAINGRDSMSGWVLPVSHGLPLERIGEVTETGGHVRSMRALLTDDADIAPIDSMLLAAEAAQEPAFARLPVLAAYGPAPSPPVVLVRGDDGLAELLRDALVGMHTDEEGRAALARGGMARFARVDDATYAPTRACDKEAATCGR